MFTFDVKLIFIRGEIEVLKKKLASRQHRTCSPFAIGKAINHILLHIQSPPENSCILQKRNCDNNVYYSTFYRYFPGIFFFYLFFRKKEKCTQRWSTSSNWSEKRWNNWLEFLYVATTWREFKRHNQATFFAPGWNILMSPGEANYIWFSNVCTSSQIFN